MRLEHIPVLPGEALAAMALVPGSTVIDATLGLGGHAKVVLEAIGPTGRLLGLERTSEGLAAAKQQLRTFQNVTLIQTDFRDLGIVAAEAGAVEADVVFFDLGLASWQIDTGHQGLSFQIDSPLDMRLSPQLPSDFTRKEDDPSQWTEDATLATVVRTWRFRSVAEFLTGATEDEISLILRGLGDVGGARTIARKLVDRRDFGPIQSTKDFVATLGTDIPEHLAPIFQALRILVNDEYGALTAGLADAWQLLKPGGRLCVISFHSGEDRITKRFLRTLDDAELGPVIKPSEAESKSNPRSRSAILRTARKHLTVDV